MKYLLLLSCLLAGLQVPAFSQENPAEEDVTLDAYDTVSAPEGFNELKYWVGVLASDSLQGRDNGTQYLDMAASFIASQYDSLGLKVLPGMDSYMQPYEVYNRRAGKKVPGQNVVGVLEGTDPDLKNEFILLSAHYDHVGVGIPMTGDSIYNGANDNASGVATMLGVAKHLQENNLAHGRSILLVAFGAEEIGLMGSAWFKDNPPVPLKDVVVNLNFEMTGHSLKLGKRNCYITGAGYSDLKKWLRGAFDRGNWNLIDNPFPNANLFYRSDNVNLARIRQDGEVYRGIPAHTVCTWGGEDHYHRPNDEAAFIDYENMQSLVEVMADFVVELGNSRDRIFWTTEDFRMLTSD